MDHKANNFKERYNLVLVFHTIVGLVNVSRLFIVHPSVACVPAFSLPSSLPPVGLLARTAPSNWTMELLDTM